MSTTDHHYKTPPGLSPNELARIAAIAHALSCTPCSNGYLFSPQRGKKFELLLRTGWKFYGWQKGGKDNCPRATFAHPKHPRITVISDAVRIARLMEAKTPHDNPV